MGPDLIIDRIEKVGRGYVLACECDDEVVVLKVKKLNGAKEGDVISFEDNRIRVLEEKTRQRRAEIIALQDSLSKKEC